MEELLTSHPPGTQALPKQGCSQSTYLVLSSVCVSLDQRQMNNKAGKAEADRKVEKRDQQLFKLSPPHQSLNHWSQWLLAISEADLHCCPSKRHLLCPLLYMKAPALTLPSSASRLSHPRRKPTALYTFPRFMSPSPAPQSSHTSSYLLPTGPACLSYSC